MNIYENIKILIESGNYQKEDIMKKLDLYLLLNRLTIEQYQELVDLINGGN